MGAVLRSAPDGPGTPPDAAALTDICWAYALPQDGVEHVRCAVRPRRADLVLFVQGPSAADAALAAGRVCLRMLTGSRQLTGWYLQTCEGITPESLTGCAGRPE
ncbi:hypothetical protein AB0M28_08650 [Streptomyces sp. NPDC051940]|uniref:hypothetical protein n=1 Tax=Streptomyces sp. NPDC051940 TaxID=3155675 RepID=UPI00342E4996